ncbi:hypothetical protein [Streptomyces sp. NPDC056144]|uniref:hypothetical protein n=1 Tax=unclassified Streptomyces TaxID=2593676 RepID=UPI0035DEE6A9
MRVKALRYATTSLMAGLLLATSAAFGPVAQAASGGGCGAPMGAGATTITGCISYVWDLQGGNFRGNGYIDGPIPQGCHVLTRFRFSTGEVIEKYRNCDRYSNGEVAVETTVLRREFARYEVCLYSDSGLHGCSISPRLYW